MRELEKIIEEKIEDILKSDISYMVRQALYPSKGNARPEFIQGCREAIKELSQDSGVFYVMIERMLISKMDNVISEHINRALSERLKISLILEGASHDNSL